MDEVNHNGKDHNHNVCLLSQTIEDAIEAYGESINYYELLGILSLIQMKYAIEITTVDEDGELDA